MSRSSKVVPSVVMAVILLLTLASAGSAGRLSLTSRPLRVVWSAFEVDESLSTIRCAVTLEGSFHSATIRKVEEALLGYVTRAVAGSPCTGGSARFLAETLPWHFTYNGFEGTLPRITGITHHLIGMALSTDPTGELTGCLYRSSPPLPTVFTGVIVSAGYRLWRILRGFNERLACGIAGIALEGDGTVTVLGSTALISISLI
jgi:hypothetical protein